LLQFEFDPCAFVMCNPIIKIVISKLKF